MKTLLYVIIPSLLAALLWLAINRDEQLRLGLFTKAAWEGISRRFSFLWEVHLRRLLGSKNRPALINIELNVVDEGTPYQGRIVLETASYFTLNFIFQPPPGRCPETHSVDISIADWEGVIHYQDRVDFCCGRDRRWMLSHKTRAADGINLAPASKFHLTFISLEIRLHSNWK